MKASEKEVRFGLPYIKKSLRRFAALWSPSAVRIVAFASGFFIFFLALIVFSSAEWSIGFNVPHSSWLDLLYCSADPLAIYFLTFFVMAVFLCRAYRGRSVNKGKLITLFSSLLVVAIGTGLTQMIEWALKKGLGRARPVARIEHGLIAARLSRQLPLTTNLSEIMFSCPVGRIVFRGSETNILGDGKIIGRLTQGGDSVSVAAAHLEAIQRRLGIGPYDITLQKKLDMFPDMAHWLARKKRPFLEKYLRSEKQLLCDIRGAAPAGAVLRQSLVLYLSIIWATFFWSSLPAARRFTGIRWAVVIGNSIALIYVGWSRIYGFRHTLSDEMLSLALAVAVFGLGTIAIYATLRSAGHELIGVFARPSAEHLLSAARVMVMYLDRDQNIGVWNNECQRVTGYSRNEIKTLDDYLILYPDSNHDSLRRRLLDNVGFRESSRNILTMITTKANERKLISWNVLYLVDIFGRVFGKLSVGTEVGGPERKLADIGLGMAMLLHDVKADLTLMLVSLHRAAHSGASGLQSESVTKALESTQRLHNLCDEFRTYAKGSFRDRKEMNILNSAQFALRIVSEIAREEGVHVILESPASLPAVFGSDFLIRHVIVTLLRNAIAACTKLTNGVPRRIIIRLSCSQGAYVLCEVIDNAANFSPSVKTQLKQGLFFVSGGIGGEIGLGLLLAHMVAQEHGGDLIIETLSDDRTSVALKLPVS